MSSGDPLSRADPGLTTAPHTTVAPYPAAAVLTAWFNAFRSGILHAPLPADGLSAREPLITTEAQRPEWAHTRIPLGVALTALQWGEPAWVALPVPGDVSGVPAGCERAMAAGQAMVLGGRTESLVLVPHTLPGGDRLWYAVRAGSTSPQAVDVRTTRQQIMAALEDAVLVAEAAVLPARQSAATAARKVQNSAVPMPPRTPGTLVTLASQSAVLSVLATEYLNGSSPATPPDVATRMQTLGRLGRQGLAVAFSAVGRG